MRTDWTSEAGATLLAKRIKEYWQGRGYSGIATGIAPVVLPSDLMRGYISNPDGTRSTARADDAFAVVSNIGPSGFPPPA